VGKYKMMNEREKIIKKFADLSDRYHNLSLLFNELSKSIAIRTQGMNYGTKEIRAYLKTLNLDFDKIKALTTTLSDIQLKDIQKNDK
jgi:ribosomal protein S17E